MNTAGQLTVFAPVLVLIVEDHPDSAESLRILLASEGVRSEWVGTVATALSRLAETKEHDGDGGSIDCVILDLTLPDARDLEAIHTLQAKFPNVPVIVNTGYRDLIVPAIHAGAIDVVLKPGDPNVWVDRVYKAIALHQVRRDYKPYMDVLREAKEAADRRASGSLV